MSLPNVKQQFNEIKNTKPLLEADSLPNYRCKLIKMETHTYFWHNGNQKILPYILVNRIQIKFVYATNYQL